MKKEYKKYIDNAIKKRKENHKDRVLDVTFKEMIEELKGNRR